MTSGNSIRQDVDLKRWIRDVPDFPRRGVLFKDITPMLQDPQGLRAALDGMERLLRGKEIGKVAGIESRGFILGAALADRLGAGFLPVRKRGKLPAATIRVSYDLEYGSDHLEMHADSVRPGERVLIVDDLLATGGTARATVELLRTLKAEIVGLVVLVELAGLSGRARLEGIPVWNLVRYDGA
jgi:adenine phosphoribosyltransferase